MVAASPRVRATAGLLRGARFVIALALLAGTVVVGIQDAAGVTWVTQTPPTGNHINDVHFPTGTDIGYAAADSGNVYKTTNGGSTWTNHATSSPDHVRGIYMVSTSVGYAVGKQGYLMKTTDGAASWTTQKSGGSEMMDVVFVDPTTGWAVGSTGTIEHTSDGSTWNPQASGVADDLFGVDFVDASTGWIVGKSGRILHTTNGGATWTPQASGTSNELHGVDMLDASTGLVAGKGGVILRTTNGGATWTPMPTPNTDDLYDVSMGTASVGYAAGNSGTVFQTVDGGLDWTDEPTGVGGKFRGLYTVPGTSEAWAVGDSGNLVHGFGPAVSNPPTTSGGTGFAVWRTNGDASPNSSDWDGSTFSGPSDTAAVGSWRIMQGARSAHRNEAILVGVDGSSVVTGQMWNGISWSALTLNPLSTVTDSFWWGFDVAYESASGDAVLVWNNGTSGTASLSYAVWNGTAWTGPSTITTPVAGEGRHLQLAAHPTTDEMVLIVSDSATQNYALVWNGATWGNPVTLDAGSGDDGPDVYLAYEGSTGDALVVYGEGSTGLRHRTWNGTVWSGETSLLPPTGVSGDVRWTTLGSDPGSDLIGLGVLTDNDEIWFSIWTGSGWNHQNLASISSPGQVYPAMAIAFEDTTGEAIATYGESGDVVRYRTWSSGTGWSGQYTVATIGAVPNSMTLAARPAGDEAMLAVQDANNDLHYLLWDGGAWGTDHELETDTGEIKNQPFLFLWQPGPPPNQPPTANDDADSVLEDGSVIIDVVDNDTDPNLDALSIDSITVPGHGGAVDSGGGTITYSPDPDWNGVDTFDYTVCDPEPLCDTATVTVTVTAVNDPPTFTVPAGDTSNEDAGAQTVAGFATGIGPGPADESGQTVSFGLTTDNDPLFSALPDIDETTGDLTYTAAGDAHGSATVTVTLSDDGGTANGGDDTTVDTFTITITAQNDPPIVTDPGAQTAYEGLPFSLTVTASDPDVPPDVITWSTVGLPPGLGIAPGTGVISGTPDASSAGPYSADITATDTAPSFDTLSVPWTVLPGAALVPGVGGGAGGDDLLTWVDRSDPNPATNEVTIGPGTGTSGIRAADLEPGTSVLYAVDGGTLGTIDRTTGTFAAIGAIGAGDGAQGTVTMTDVNSLAFHPLNARLYAVEDRSGTNDLLFRIDPATGALVPDEFGPGVDYVEIDNIGARDEVTGAAIDPTDGTLYVSVGDDGGAPNQRLATVDLGTGDISSINDLNPLQIYGLAFDPAGQLWGVGYDKGSPATEMVYDLDKSDATFGSGREVDDGSSYEAIGIPHPSPFLNTDPTTSGIGPVGVLEDASPSVVDLWAAFADAEDADADLTYTVTANTNPALVATGINPGTGELTLTYTAEANGTSDITVRATDTGALWVETTFTATVTAVNDAPTFTVPAGDTSLEDAGAQTVPGFASGITAGPPDESGQTLTFSLSTDNDPLFAVLPSIDEATGDLTYTAAADASGSATVTVTLSDDGGTANGGDDTTIDTFTITVTAVNDAPGFTVPAGDTSLEDAGAQTVAGFATGITPGPADETSQTLTFSLSTDNDPLFAVLPSIDEATGDLTYTAAPDGSGTATVTVTLTDDGGVANGGADTTIDTFTITVTADNDTPTTTGIGPIAVLEDAAPSTVDLWAAFGDVEDPDTALTYTVEANTNGALVATGVDPFTGELTLTYTPDTNGTADLTVRATDTGALWTETTFTATVTAVNDAPGFTVPAGDTSLEDAGAQTVPGFASGITPGPADETGQTLTFSLTTDNDPLFSVLPSIDEATGDLTYTAAPDGNGTATVTVTLTDDGGTTNGGADTTIDTFTITVTAVNDSPGFTVPAGDTSLEDAGAQTVLGFASGITAGPPDESGQTSTFSLSTDNDPLFAVLPSIDEATGDLTYTAAADASGSATVTVTLTDDGGAANGGDDTTIDTFTITVTAVNDAPGFTVPAGDTSLEDAGAQTVAGFASGITPGPADEAGQTLTFSLTTDNDPLFSVLPSIDETTGDLTYTAAPDGNGTATVTVTLTDDGGVANGGADTTIDTFTITVTADNDTPTTTGIGPIAVLEDAAPSTVDLWAAFGDVEDPDTALTYTVEANTNGALVATGVDPFTGELTLTYTPDTNGTADLTVRATDTGALWTETTFTATVTAVNDAPGFTVPAGDTSLEDAGAQTVAGFASGITPGPADEAGQTLTFSLTTDNDPLFSVLPSIDEATGDLTYTAAPDGNGTATVTVTLTDDGGVANGGADTTIDTFTITITPVNDTPTFTVPAGDTSLEDAGAQTVPGFASGITAGPPDESGQTSTFSLSTDNDPLFAVLPSIDEATGDLTYTAAPDANGSATVTVTLTDDGGTANGGNDTTIDTFTISITPVDDPPVAAPDGPYTVAEGGTLTVPAPGVLGNDSDIDAGDVLTAALATPPTAGTATVSPGGGFTYIHDGSETASDVFTYALDDGSGPPVAGAVTISITPVNDPPKVVIASPPPAKEGAPATVQGTVTDPDGLPSTVTIAWGDGTSSTTTPTPGGTFAASHTYLDDGDRTVTASVTDTAGATASATRKISVANVAPTVTVSGVSGAGEIGTVIPFEATVADAGVLDTHSIMWSVSLDGAAESTSSGAVLDLPLGAVGTYRVTVQATDDDGAVSEPVVREIVASPDPGPEPAIDRFQVNPGETLVVAAPGVLANDVDPGGDLLSASLGTAPDHGTIDLRPDGSFTYVHDGSLTDTDRFTYAVSDGYTTATGTVEIDIVNRLPVAEPDEVALDEDGSAVFSVLANDSDPDGDELSVAAIDTAPAGSIRLLADGGYLFTPGPDWNGSQSLEYTVADTRGGTATGTVTFIVRPVNDAPVVGGLDGTGDRNGIEFRLLDGVFDVDGDAVTAEILVEPAHGSVEVLGTELVRYTPLPGYAGPDEFTYVVDDGHGGRTSAVVRIEVIGGVSGQELSTGLIRIVSREPLLGSEEDFAAPSLPGMRILIGAFFQTWELLRMPLFILAIVFLGSMAFGVSRGWIFTGDAVHLSPRPPSKVGIVGLGPGEHIPARSAPGDRNDIAHQFAAAQSDIPATGKRAQFHDTVWVEIITPDGDEAWLSAEFLTGHVPTGRFVSDPRPVEMVGEFADVIAGEGDPSHLISDRGLWIVHHAPPERTPHWAMETILTDPTMWSWWTQNGSTQDLDGTFHDVIARPLLGALRRLSPMPDPPDTIPVPVELANFHSLALRDEAMPEVGAWRIFFEYAEEGEPAIVGLWREASLNSNAVGNRRTRRLIGTA